jgi:hypothetical protein
MAVALVLAMGCGDDKPPPKAKSKKASAQSQPAATAQKKPAPRRSGTWPYIADEQQLELADNLTAKNFLLIFDGSGSMKESGCSGGRPKIEVARAAVAEWSQTMDADANLGLVAFNWKGWYLEPLAAGNRDRFINTVNGVEVGGKTPLTEAMERAFGALTRQARKQLGYGEFTIVVVTDGIANDTRLLANRVRQILKVSPIDLYTIGFCIGTDHSLNQPGRTTYKAANNPEELRQGLQEVLAEAEQFDITDFSD